MSQNETISKQLKEKLLSAGPLANMIGDRLFNYESEADNQVGKYEVSMKSLIKKENLTLTALILMLLGVQLLPALVLLAILNVFGALAGVFMALMSWILIFASAIYVLAYILVWKFEEKLKGSSLCYVFYCSLSICESLLIFYFSSFVSEESFLIGVSIIVSGLFVNSVFASYVNNDYTTSIGKSLAIITTISIYVLSALFLQNSMLIQLVLSI